MKLNMTSSGGRRWALLLLVLLLGIASAGAKTTKPPKGPKSHDLTDTIYANPILTNFAQMLQAAPDVYTFLSSRGPFTIFVPNDSAFTKLSPGVFAALLRPENKERLQDILYFHVINGKRLAIKELVPLHAMFSCFNSIPLTFKTTHSGVSLVTKARITHADIHCANGNINEIDTLLMPPEAAIPPLKFVPDAAPAAGVPAVTPVSPTGDTNAAPAGPTPFVVPLTPSSPH